MKTMHLLILPLALGAAATANAQANAQTNAPTNAQANAQTQFGADAQLPPSLRNRPAAPAPAAGAALRAQALAKLEAQFRAADADGNGRLTREEAEGFGYVARHFDAIDTRQRGTVSFAELRAHLERARAERPPP